MSLRGVSASSAQGGSTLAIATGNVVVSVFGEHPSLAREAADDDGAAEHDRATAGTAASGAARQRL